jgi:hypothetical protein
VTRRVRDVDTLRPFCAIIALIAAVASPVGAQTDYYNTSAGRPQRIEDALPVEYRAIELNITPLRWEIGRNAAYQWTLEPEAAIGLLPRTQFQIGVPLTFIDRKTTSARGATGLELSVMHALNAETSIPALAVAGDVLLPVGALAAESAYGTVKGIVTRTFRAARIHANAQVTVGPTPADSASADEASDASRWLAGVAVDKTFPLQSVLVSIETFAEQPLRREASLEWNAGIGARLQLTPRWAFDAGAGRRLTGSDQAWYMTLGSAYAVGFR